MIEEGGDNLGIRFGRGNYPSVQIELKQETKFGVVLPETIHEISIAIVRFLPNSTHPPQSNLVYPYMLN
jgi:hypothetical protein